MATERGVRNGFRLSMVMGALTGRGSFAQVLTLS
jgi:hypothetical protein